MKTLTPILFGILLGTTAHAQTSRQLNTNDLNAALSNGGTLTLTRNLVMPGTGAYSQNLPANSLLFVNPQVSGSCTYGGCAINYFGATLGVNQGASPGPWPVMNTDVFTSLGGSGHVGSFWNLNTMLHIDSPTGNTTNQFYQAINIDAQANSADGGTLGNERGSLFGFGVYSRLWTNAAHWVQVIGGEVDLGILSGASALYQGGIQVVLAQENAIAATNENFGFMISAQGGAAPTIDCAYCIGGYQGVNPIAATGDLFAYHTHANTGPSPTVANGVNLSKVNFTGNAFSSPGFAVDGSGNTTLSSVIGVASQSLYLRPGTGGGAVGLLNAASGGILQASTDGSPTGSTNNWDFHGTNSGSGVVYLQAAGADASINMDIRAKGPSGSINFGAGGGDALGGSQSLQILGNSSDVNYLTITGNTTGNPAQIGAAGTDGNIGITLAPKGTGVVRATNVFQFVTTYTVATLPTCNAGSKATLAVVTDASAPTYNATVAGSGAVTIPVFCNGTNWTAH